MSYITSVSSTATANSGTVTITPNTNTASSGYVLTGGTTGPIWTTTPMPGGMGYGPVTISNSTTGITGTSKYPSISVTGDAEFDGDVKIKGRSIAKLLEKIEDRLAILMDPDPEKLEKFAALKKAYNNYKLLDKLCVEENEKKSK
jgi:hypothetical protein